jgi:hypothetical protein
MQFSNILVLLIGLVARSNASCHGDCKIQCNPYNTPYCSGECVGRCMVARCPEYVISMIITFRLSFVVLWSYTNIRIST